MCGENEEKLRGLKMINAPAPTHTQYEGTYQFEKNLSRMTKYEGEPRIIVARGTSDDKVSVRLKMRRQMNRIRRIRYRTGLHNFAKTELVSFTLATTVFRSS